MARTLLEGLNGANPLGFMASVGLLRLLDGQGGNARLGFTEDGTFRAWLECDHLLDIADVVSADAAGAVGPQPWRLEYDKAEKKGVKTVADLKPPPEKFADFLAAAISEWVAGKVERSDYAAAYGTDIAVDGKKNTKPTAFHFTAANQQFLAVVEETRRMITSDWVKQSLEDSPAKARPGSNLRWDPDAERSRALMGANPNNVDTVVNAPLEWLAFRALPAFPCVPIGNRIVTCGVTGRRQDELRFHWPLWSCGASYATVRSLVRRTAAWVEHEERIKYRMDECRDDNQRQRALARLQWELEGASGSRRARGVFAVCTSVIRRTEQGFGNFGPATVRP